MICWFWQHDWLYDGTPAASTVMHHRVCNRCGRRQFWNKVLLLLGRLGFGRAYLMINDRASLTARADLREQLAALAHEQWSGWMRYMFTRGNHLSNGDWLIEWEWVQRWRHQANLPYADLLEAEKDSDRKEADRVLAIVLADPERREQDKFEHLKSLQKNWDSYDAEPIDAAVIDAAKLFIARMDVVPCSDGGVQLEWHTHGLDLELDFSADGTLDVFVESKGAKTHVEAADARAEQAAQERDEDGLHRSHEWGVLACRACGCGGGHADAKKPCTRSLFDAAQKAATS